MAYEHNTVVPSMGRALGAQRTEPPPSAVLVEVNASIIKSSG